MQIVIAENATQDFKKRSRIGRDRFASVMREKFGDLMSEEQIEITWAMEKKKRNRVIADRRKETRQEQRKSKSVLGAVRGGGIRKTQADAQARDRVESSSSDDDSDDGNGDGGDDKGEGDGEDDYEHEYGDEYQDIRMAEELIMESLHDHWLG